MRNVKIDVDFTPNSIISVDINHPNRVSIIEGGKPTGTRVVFEIDELLPDEVQDIEVLIQGKDITSLSAWSEKLGDVEKIFILDIVIEPDIGTQSMKPYSTPPICSSDIDKDFPRRTLFEMFI